MITSALPVPEDVLKIVEGLREEFPGLGVDMWSDGYGYDIALRANNKFAVVVIRLTRERKTEVLRYLNDDAGLSLPMVHVLRNRLHLKRLGD